MTVISISSHEVDAVAVLIPEGSLIGQGTVGDGDVVVMVISGEWTTMVVCHGVTYKDEQQGESVTCLCTIQLTPNHPTLDHALSASACWISFPILTAILLMTVN